MPSIHNTLTSDAIGAADSLSVMIEKETHTYHCHDYLNLPSHDATLVTEEDRMKIVDWCYSVIDHCQFNRETVAVAMELVDRFLSTSTSLLVQQILRDKKLYQLAAMGALYISIKLNERVAFGSDFFAAMSRGAYTVQEIEDMELSILRGVGWRVNAPTSLQMANHILSLTLPHTDIHEKTWGFILDEVRFQAEHSVRDYYFSTARKSTVAMACIFNALEQASQKDRVEILNGLLFVLQDFAFDSATTLFSARSRLLMIIEGNQSAGEMENDPSNSRSRCISYSESEDEVKVTPLTLDDDISPRLVASLARY